MGEMADFALELVCTMVSLRDDFESEKKNFTKRENFLKMVHIA